MSSKVSISVTNEPLAVREKFDPKTGIKRGLKQRHISMMALAGIMGPGVFLGMGVALHEGGPVGLIAGFAIVGVLIMGMMTSIGELNGMFDFNFNTHACRWVDPAFGAALGWIYVIVWLCNIFAEYVSLTSILSTYSDKVPMYGYYLIFWFVFSIYQMLGVDVFGEVEYILAFLKILFISGYYLFSIIYAAGGIKNHSPGNLFKEYPLAHGFKGIVNSFVFAGAFYTGIESLSVTFLELKQVESAVKLAVRQSVFRIFYVYFGLSISYGISVAWNDPGLSSTETALKSPMTIALTNAGWKNSKYYITTIVLITCLSSINSAIYFSARCLFRLSSEGYAPKIFKNVSKRGVPWVATHTVHLFGFLSLLAMSQGASDAYTYLVNIGGVGAFIAWTAIVYTHLRFRKGWLRQGNSLEDLPYKAPFYPYLNYISLGLGILLCLVQGWSVFVPFSAANFVDVYIIIPFFFILWIGYKLCLKTKWVKYEDMDFISGKNNMAACDESISEEPQYMDVLKVSNETWFRKLWSSI